jgi:hypothetical protein
MVALLYPHFLTKTTWFLSLTSFPPEKRVRIGQLITDPRNPDEILGTGPLILAEQAMEVEEQKMEDVIFHKTIERSAGFGFSDNGVEPSPIRNCGGLEKE